VETSPAAPPRRIDPFAALEPEDPRYVEQIGAATGLSGRVLAKRLRKGLAPMLFVGHPGLGKSTELRRAHAALLADGPAVLIDLAALDVATHPDRVLYDLATATLRWWVADGPDAQPSPFLVSDLRASDPTFPQGQGRTLKPVEIARSCWEELTGAAGVERLPLLVDGIDAMDVDEGREVLLALLALEELADLAVVGAPALATGPENLDVVDRYRVVTVSPVDPGTADGAAFLAGVARAHLGEAAIDEARLRRLTAASGGVLRDLLGLVRDARAYADEEIDDAAIDAAIRDRTERFRRLLLAGDRKALRKADGTSGLEVEAARKVRLLQQGLLLETGIGADAHTRLHPLVSGLLGRK
jgi:hypothetical protein